MRIRDVSLGLAALAFTACGDDPKPAPAPSKPASTPATASSGIPVSMAPKAEEHAHEGKHGGTLLEVGAEDGHVEIVHDAATGTLTAFVSDGAMKPLAVDAPMINITKGGVQVPMKPLAGTPAKTDAWTATHHALKVDPLDGRLRLKIGDRTFQVALEEEHAHK